MHPDIVCDRCIKGVVERGKPAGSIRYLTFSGLDFFGCPHLSFVEQEHKQEHKE